MFFRKSQNFNLSETIAGCKQGKQLAQKKLFEQYYSFVKRVCLRYANNEDEAQEIVNDGFLKVFAKLDYYDPEQPFEAWLRTVVVRVAIDYYRKHHARITLTDLDYAEATIGEEAESLGNLSANEILELVQKLPPAYRTVFSLYVVEGYQHNEIAEMLGINEGTSKSNLSKARQKLQKQLSMNNSIDTFHAKYL